MITRISLLVLIIIAVCFSYIHVLFLHRKALWLRILWWIPAFVMFLFTIYLSLQSGFTSESLAIVEIYLLLLGLLILPLFVFTLFSAIGLFLQRFRPKMHKYGLILGAISVILIWYIVLSGTFFGFNKLSIKHIEIAFDNLPSSFDGYNIVQFSDAHVGTFSHRRSSILQNAIDSIMSCNADIIVFTGDLQNIEAKEIISHATLLSSLSARDGVFSILGNHDYAEYAPVSNDEKEAYCTQTISVEQSLGWILLRNDSYIIRRGEDSIVIAGMENEGKGIRQLARADIHKTLKDIDPKSFILMLEHDPRAWRSMILPESNASLTLSGHTHGMQLGIMGWPLSKIFLRNSAGLYCEGGRFLYVSTGMGALIPFRFGLSGEIILITLKTKKKTI